MSFQRIFQAKPDPAKPLQTKSLFAPRPAPFQESAQKKAAFPPIHLGQDHSAIPFKPVRPAPALGPSSISCPFTPERCPFGGACHACPPKMQMQAKLKIGQPGDRYEQEADRVAETVMRMPEPQVQRKAACAFCADKDEEDKLIQTKPLAEQITPLAQRKPGPEAEKKDEDDDALVQAKSASGIGNAQVDHPLIQSVLASPGQPLDAATRSFMEPRFGQDFSGVRVHLGGQAAESARAVNARAYTVGRDVVFGEGQYVPGSDEGRRLVAHELAHVGQQTDQVSPKLNDESQTQSFEETVSLPNWQQQSISTWENSPVVTDNVLPNQAVSGGNKFDIVARDIGDIAEHADNTSFPKEAENGLATNLQTDAKQTDEIYQETMTQPAGNTVSLNLEASEEEPQLELPAIPEPALPDSPDMAQAAQQIMQRSEAEKAALSQAVEAKRNTLMQQAEATAKTIEDKNQIKIQAIAANLTNKKADVKKTINTTNVSARSQIANQKKIAQTEGANSLRALRKEIETKRKEVLDASDAEGKQIEQTGQTEAKRVMLSSAESSARIYAIANQKANSFSDKPKEVQSTVREAVGQTATDVTGKMQQRSQELAKNAKEASQKTAKGLRDAGTQLASGIGNNTTQVKKAIQDGTNATVNQIANQELHSQQKLDALQIQAVTSIEKLKASSIADIKQSGQVAAAAARKTGQNSAAQISKAKAASLQQFDKGVNQVVVQLNQVPVGQNVNKKAVDQLVQEAGSKLQQANTLLGGMISEQATSSQSTLNQLGATVPGHLDGTQQKVTAEANKATTGLNSGLAGVPTQITQASQQAITENKNTNQQAVQQFGDGLQQQIDKAKQSWSQEKEKVNNNICGKIDEGVKSNKAVESKAPADFTELANTAAAKAEESLVSKIFSGILEGIKKVAFGLAIFVAVVAVIVGVESLIAGAFIGWPAVLAIAGIVGVGFLLYGIFTAFIKRTDDFWKTYGANIPWYAQVGGFFAVLGLAIGDTVGITPIIEGIVGKEAFTGKEFTPEQRAEKITEGVLTIALMFIMGRVFKWLSKSGGVPLGEIKPGEVKSGEAKAGEVKQKEPKPDDPIPTEPGVKARRTTVDGHHEIKVTERGTIRCTTCGSVENAYPKELEQRPDLQERLSKAKEKEATDPESVAEEVKNIDAELAAVRRANLTKAKAESRRTIEEVKKLLNDKKNIEKISGEDRKKFSEEQRRIENDWNNSNKHTNDANGDPDLEGIVLEEFEIFVKESKKLESDISKVVSGSKTTPWPHGSITKLGRRNIANHQVEVHVDERGPHVHLDRGTGNEQYINLKGTSVASESTGRLPSGVAVEPTVLNAMQKAIDTWKQETGE